MAEICYYDEGTSFRPDLTRLPDNLVCPMEYLDLLRDCCVALNFPMIPNTRLVEVCPVTGKHYAGGDQKLNKERHRLWRDPE